MSEIKGQAPTLHQKDLIIEKCEEIKVVETIEDEYLGKIQLYRLHPYVKYVASKTIPTQYIQNFQKRIQMRHPHIFFYINKAHANQISTNQNFTIFFEHNYFSLDQMIQRRKENSWHYPEIELWTLLKEVTGGLKFLMDQSLHHGEIKKSSIFFDDEYLLYRVYDNQIVNADKYYQYQKNNQVLIDNGTPPPEFSSYEYIQFKNTYKVDIWNFGLILLECATLQNVQELVYSNGSLKTESLNSLLQSLNGKYSSQFISFLLKMLEPDPRIRLDWQQIQKQLSKEQLAQAPPPYQVEPTILHPSRSLRDLHEIVVGAQPQSNSAQKENVFTASTTEKQINTQNFTTDAGLNSWGAVQATKKEEVYSNSQTDSTMAQRTKKEIKNEEGENQIDEIKLSQPLVASNQAINHRLMQLNKKIQDTLTQSQKQTKKILQNGSK